MSLQTTSREVTSPPTSSQPWSPWLWLGVAAVLVIAIVVGFLKAGRTFWKVSALATDSSIRPTG